jgi:hypothetical protein
MSGCPAAGHNRAGLVAEEGDALPSLYRGPAQPTASYVAGQICYLVVLVVAYALVGVPGVTTFLVRAINQTAAKRDNDVRPVQDVERRPVQRPHVAGQFLDEIDPHRRDLHPVSGSTTYGSHDGRRINPTRSPHRRGHTRTRTSRQCSATAGESWDQAISRPAIDTPPASAHDFAIPEYSPNFREATGHERHRNPTPADRRAPR